MSTTKNNLSGRFFYINPDATPDENIGSRMYPMDELLALHMADATSLYITFDDMGVDDHTVVDITIESGKGREAIKEVIDAINSTQQIVTLVDRAKQQSVISYWNKVGIAIYEGDPGTFALSGDLSVAGAATFNGGIKRFVKTTATAPILAANSGIPHIVGPSSGGLASDAIFSLPAVAADLYYKFVYVGGQNDAQNFQLNTGSNTNYFIGGIAHFDIDTDDTSGIPDVIYSDNNSNSRLNILTPSAGTWVEVYCDGVNWFVTGVNISSSDTGVTFADQS